MRVNLRGLPADRRMLCKLRSNVQTKQMRGFKSAHFQKDQEMVVASVFQDDPFYVIAFAETKMTKNRQLPEVEAHRFESYNMKPCFDLYPPGKRQYEVHSWQEITHRSCNLQRQDTEDMLMAGI